MSKNDSVMTAKCWMLAGFAVFVLSLVTCHQAFAYSPNITITPFEIEIRQSYVRTIIRLQEDKEGDELYEDLEYRMAVLSQCGAYRIYQAGQADTEELNIFRFTQGAKLVTHFILLAMAIEDTLGIEHADVDFLNSGISGATMQLVAQFTTMLSENNPNITSKQRAETRQNMDSTCLNRDARVEGREWDLTK